MSVIFGGKLKEEMSLPRSNEILLIEQNQAGNQAACTYFMQMCRTGVKDAKVNTLKCFNFVSFSSLKNSSDT